jgi:hypothetical protein
MLFAVPTSAFVKGLKASPSADVNQILATSVGQALYSAAKTVLARNFNLTPVGSETKAQLLERIALVYMENVAIQWTGSITAGSVNADWRLDTVADFISPLSNRKPEAPKPTPLILLPGGMALTQEQFTAISEGQTKASAGPKTNLPMVIGLFGVGFLALWFFSRGQD